MNSETYPQYLHSKPSVTFLKKGKQNKYKQNATFHFAREKRTIGGKIARHSGVPICQTAARWRLRKRGNMAGSGSRLIKNVSHLVLRMRGRWTYLRMLYQVSVFLFSVKNTDRLKNEYHRNRLNNFTVNSFLRNLHIRNVC